MFVSWVALDLLHAQNSTMIPPRRSILPGHPLIIIDHGERDRAEQRRTPHLTSIPLGQLPELTE